MADPTRTDGTTPTVHGLLLCRRVETSAHGDLTLHEIVEVLPVDAFPADAGPLTFVAFVRSLPPGPGQAMFVLRTTGESAREVARLPLPVNVPRGFGGRQVALQLRVPSVPVQGGGWYEVVFEWNGTPLASNRFAIGMRATGARPVE
jgi:hypothetical protein